MAKSVVELHPRISHRRACRLLFLSRSSYLYKNKFKDDRALRMKMRDIAQARPRYGYRRIHILLRREGLIINHKKVRRIYREENLFVRISKHRKHRVVTQLRVPPPTPKNLNQIWSMDFVHDELYDGRKIRCLTLVDKLSRECLRIEVDYRLRAQQVVNALDFAKIERGVPEIICVDNGSEFTSKILDQWAYFNGVKLHFIKLGKPTENGHIESFNGRFRDEYLNTHVFTSIAQAQDEIERWSVDYNNWRPHTSIGNLTPREFARRKMKQQTA